MPELTSAEQRILEAGYEWVDANADRLIELLTELVSQQSITGREGVHTDADSVVGTLWDFLDAESSASELAVQRLPESVEAEYTDAPRENVYAVMPGQSDSGFIAQSHTDVVPPGAHSAWPDGEPFTVSPGTARRIDRQTIEITAGGETRQRGIRENLAAVWDQRGVEEVEVLVGRGVYDNKACSVCLIGSLLALEAAIEQEGGQLGGDLIHGHLVDEEKEQLGIKNMVGWQDNENWLGDRYASYDDFGAVILEGQYGFVPVVGHRGGINLTITATGEAVHGSTPALGRNAVLGIAKGLARLDTPGCIENITAPFIDDELLGDFTVAPGTTIAGGGITDVDPAAGTVTRDGGAEYAVADWCQATVDCRIPRWTDFPADPEAVHDQFLGLIHDEFQAAAPDIEFQVESNMFFLPIAIGEDREAAARHPLVQTAKRATQDVGGYEPDIAVAPGATDAWVLYHGTHIPTLVEYGPAGALSHEPCEYVEREQIAVGAKTLLNMTIRQLGITRTEAE